MRWFGALLVVIGLWPGTALAQTFDILWYDHGEEAVEIGSLREHLTAAGHRVTHVTDGAGNIDLSAPAYAGYEVVVASHTAGTGTLVGLEAWLSSGKGYVAFVGPNIYGDAEDEWIRTRLNVDVNGEPIIDPVVGTVDWNPIHLNWAVDWHQIYRWPNRASTINLTAIVAENERSMVVTPGGLTVIDAIVNVVVIRERLLGPTSGRVAMMGTYFSGAERANINTRRLVENLVIWATGPVCGNAIFDGDVEACDDGNLVAGDGCSPTCEEEHGWTCDDAEPSFCFSDCADRLIASDEQCDDGNFDDGDG